MAIQKPSWFAQDRVMVSTAPTCGLTKGGRTLALIDPLTGKRVQTKDVDTGALIDAVDDQLLMDMNALSEGRVTETLRFIPSSEVSLRNAVPVYYDKSFHERFLKAMLTPKFAGFRSATLGTLRDEGLIELRGGHGSPSHDQRVGEVPYIKVSDLRAGLVNINPTNRIPVSVAKQFWKADSSGLRAYDLVCPERTSKNIGDFCILMPGQERVVLTKEIIVLRPGKAASFDAFYLLWAMTLKIVREQWKRIIFMQTNREDVGRRFWEIEIPIPKDRKQAMQVSEEFRKYYVSLAKARIDFGNYLQETGAHHFFVAGGAEEVLGD
jgi:hypothetical protein